MSTNKIKIATLQGKWTGDFDSNNAWYVEQARALKGKGYDLVVLPELFHTPYFPFEENADFFDLAIEKDHPLVSQWQSIAKELNAVVVFPFFEKRARGTFPTIPPSTRSTTSSRATPVSSPSRLPQARSACSSAGTSGSRKPPAS